MGDRKPTELPPPADDAGDVEAVTGKKTIAAQLMEFAEERLELGQDETGQPFAVDRKGPNVAIPLGSAGGAVSTLALMYYEKTGKTPSSNPIQEVKRVLEARAMQQEATLVPIRVAGYRGQIVIDIGDAEGRAIVLRPGAWKIVPRSPGVFRRTACVLPMPDPVARGKGRPEAMRKLFNFGDEEWDFILNWQAIAFVPDIPHVMPILEGNPGTAKTTATRLLVDIVDPSKGALNAPPRDQKHLDVAAGGSWAFALENVSYLSRDMSDGLARLITGAATRDRTLYSDNDVYVRELRRIVIMNGIRITGIQPDLLDRSVSIVVPQIERSRRMTDEECNERYVAAGPSHLGFLLDLLSRAMGVAESGEHELTEFGRMADFEKWLHYCDVVRGTNTLKWYQNRRNADAAGNAIDDVLAVAIEEYLSTSGGRSADMAASGWLSVLQAPPGAGKQWPGSNRAFTQLLRMHMSGLEMSGWKLREHVRGGRSWWKIALPQADDDGEGKKG